LAVLLLVLVRKAKNNNNIHGGEGRGGAGGGGYWPKCRAGIQNDEKNERRPGKLTKQKKASGKTHVDLNRSGKGEADVSLVLTRLE
jgi:hypothetical protein